MHLQETGSDHPHWHLVADIGGTNARFGLAAASGAGRVEDIQTLSCAEYGSIEQAVGAYLDGLAESKRAAVRDACVAIAGPTEGDTVSVTNLSWEFSKRKVGATFGYNRFEVINDFAALALSCPVLDPAYMTRLGSASWTDSEVAESAPRAVVGPGTGLGVCGLLPEGEGWQALPGEGGHSALAPVTDEEFALLQFLRRDFEHVSAEHLLSGRGIENIHRGLAAVRDQAPAGDSAADISVAALGGRHRLAQDTILMFCDLLGSFCGDVVLKLGARGGVYLGGGILPRVEPLLRESQFEQRMCAKGVMSDYLNNLPVYLVRHPFPALSGAAAYLGRER